MEAIVTCGGRISGEFADSSGTTIKGLVKVKGITLLEQALAALKGSKYVHRIVVVGPAELKDDERARLADEIIPEGSTGADNIRLGLEAVKPDEDAVFCTSDLPFITSEDIDSFLEKCPEDAEICYPVIEKSEMEDRDRKGISGFVSLRDGLFTGGSIFRVRVDMLLSNMDKISAIFDARKSEFRMVRLLGLGFSIKFLLKLLDINDMERRVSGIMGCRCKVIRKCSPSLVFDIDSKEIWEYAKNL